jgi:hypothetical protein
VLLLCARRFDFDRIGSVGQRKRREGGRGRKRVRVSPRACGWTRSRGGSQARPDPHDINLSRRVFSSDRK